MNRSELLKSVLIEYDIEPSKEAITVLEAYLLYWFQSDGK